MELSRQQIHTFQEKLWQGYREHGRPDLPWRQPEPDGSFDPYRIMVSELMLQQTQVSRVIPKYQAFLETFPDIDVLAKASLADVLRLWQGLGYNRRAKFLWQAAQVVAASGTFPDSLEKLVELPGVGRNTAGAILAYAFDRPVVFIETNIRSVYLHYFFPAETGVDDKRIEALVSQTLERDHPREFYWALMDYGSWLKSQLGNPNRASKHYAKQSAFHGSRRQLRGQVLRLLGERPLSRSELGERLDDARLPDVLSQLAAEGMITLHAGRYHLG